MDTLSHALWGVLLFIWFTTNPWILLLGAFLGALPDIIGWLNKKICKNSNAWDWYVWAHSKWNLLNLLSPYGFHVLLDSFTHGEGKRWWVKNERLYAEILNWLLLIFLFILIL